MAEKSRESKPDKDPITIKKYANRRLYNTATSSYVTLDHLAQMVKDGADFVVYDAKSGDDITGQVLTHIIVEEESKGQNLLPISFLRHLISFYGDSLQSLVPRYLEYSMHSFANNQEQMRHYLQDALDGLMPFNQFDEIGRQNMAMFENAMQTFFPFQNGGSGSKSGKGGSHAPVAPEAPEGPQAPDATEKPDLQPDLQIDELRSKLDQMQKQLDSLTSTDK